MPGEASVSAEDSTLAYERGVTAGEIAARLAGHDRHFASINGSLAQIADEMHALNMGVQRLADQAEAAAKTVVTTASALKDAQEARRDKATQTWSPMAKLATVLGSLSALAAVIAFLTR